MRVFQGSSVHVVKPENDEIDNAMPTDCLHCGKGGQRPETKASESLITGILQWALQLASRISGCTRGLKVSVCVSYPISYCHSLSQFEKLMEISLCKVLIGE